MDNEVKQMLESINGNLARIANSLCELAKKPVANTAGTAQTGSNKGGAQSVSLRVCTFKNGESLVEGSTANGDYFRTNVYADGYGWHTMFVKKTGHEQIWDKLKQLFGQKDNIVPVRAFYTESEYNGKKSWQANFMSLEGEATIAPTDTTMKVDGKAVEPKEKQDDDIPF